MDYVNALGGKPYMMRESHITLSEQRSSSRSFHFHSASLWGFEILSYPSWARWVAYSFIHPNSILPLTYSLTNSPLAISPWFNTHYGTDTYNKNWIFYSDTLWGSRWDQVLEVNPQFLEIVTWNGVFRFVSFFLSFRSVPFFLSFVRSFFPSRWHFFLSFRFVVFYLRLFPTFPVGQDNEELIYFSVTDFGESHYIGPLHDDNTDLYAGGPTGAVKWVKGWVSPSVPPSLLPFHWHSIMPFPAIHPSFTLLSFHGGIVVDNELMMRWWWDEFWMVR